MTAANTRPRVAFVASAGGHLTQLLRLAPLFGECRSVVVTERTPVATDLPGLPEGCPVEYLRYGSRRDLLRYPFVLLYNVARSLALFARYRPDVVVTTGAHTAVPLCYIARLFGRRVVFIESFAKRHSPTLSGRLVYPIATTFVVQWPEMLAHYPRAEYWGSIY